MSRAIVAVLGLLAWATTAHAQKPVCAFSSDGAPGWVLCGTISGDATDAELARAAERSRASGFQWIVQIGYNSPVLQHAGDVSAAVKARFDRFGLWPFVAATAYGEEWHEHCLGGAFFAAPLWIPAWSPACGDLVVQWLSVQHARMKAVTGKPVLWITGTVAPGRLVPTSTDFVAVDYYPQDGQPFAAIEPVFVMAEQYTDLPLVLVMRWFKNTGPYQGPLWHTGAADPLDEWAAGYARLAQHPRVVALMGFLWQSRPWAQLVGLEDMPATHAAVVAALRARGIIR